MNYGILNKFLEVAKKEMGVHEFVNGSNPRIVEYDAATSLKATNDKIPWCAAFACWVLEQCDVISPRSAAARSFLDWGLSIDNPVPGCLVIYKRGLDITKGHVNFFTGFADKNHHLILGLGGNQHDEVNISSFLMSDVLGFRLSK